MTDNWEVTFEGLWDEVEEMLNRGLPITDDVLAEYVAMSARKQLRSLNKKEWESAFNGLYVGAREQAYKLTGFGEKKRERFAQIVDTLEEQAVLAKLRNTALSKVVTITDKELRAKILEKLSEPGAYQQNPTQLANQIIREERAKLEEQGGDRKQLKEQIKSLYDDQLWKIQRITRTESANAYWISQLTGYKEQGIEQIKFNSHTYAQGTCATCLAFDGIEFDIDRLIREGGQYPLSHLTHPNCRCVGAGSEVLVRGRGWVPIETVRVRESVLDVSYNWSKVTQVAVFHKRHDHKADVPVVRVLGVPLTEDHLIWTANGWSEAGRVEAGQLLVRGVRGPLPEPPASSDPLPTPAEVLAVVPAVEGQAAKEAREAPTAGRDPVSDLWSALPRNSVPPREGPARDHVGRIRPAFPEGTPEVRFDPSQDGRDVQATWGRCKTPDAGGSREDGAVQEGEGTPQSIRSGFQGEGFGGVASSLHLRSGVQAETGGDGAGAMEASRCSRTGSPPDASATTGPRVPAGENGVSCAAGSTCAGYVDRARGSTRSAGFGDSVPQAQADPRNQRSLELRPDRSIGSGSEGGDRGRWLPLAQLPEVLSGQETGREGPGGNGACETRRLDDAPDLGARHPSWQDVAPPEVLPAAVEADPEPPEVFCDIGTESHHFLVRAPGGGEPFGVHNCWPVPVITHVTMESMEEMYRDKPDLFAPGQTVFDQAQLALEDVVKDYQNIYGTQVHDLPVEHERDVTEALDVIGKTPYQEFQPRDLRFVRDVGDTDEFQEAIPTPEPVLGQVTSWMSPNNEMLVSQFSSDNGQTISGTILREWASTVYDDTEMLRNRAEAFFEREAEQVGPADISPETIDRLLITFEPHSMMRRQLVDDLPTVALEKRLRDADDEKLLDVLLDLGITSEDVETIVHWRRDRPVWALDGTYVPPEGLTGSEHNRFVNRTAEQGPREMFVESAVAYVADPWTLRERDPEMYDFLRAEVFGEQEFKEE